ncbi:hypothetical protein DN752_01830 [Echinicola strongylocentroti]|uniref:Uncharacterized protein n=1 Tax=Echinicola strongylocentroti TaxID=1795355 RepID=A0A2Z4IEV3_9BACT|nr:hypothetical protein [Echinicola strongylocentroti]AWW28973.1 hypothetical protein DN752_01830 [Echinicola strongylocentroti]
MALYLFNISADAPDLRPFYMPEDLTINDQESIVELIMETILGFEGVFAEYDDPDTDDEGSTFDLSVFVVFEQSNALVEPFLELIRRRSFYISKALVRGFGQLEGPPPKGYLFF